MQKNNKYYTKSSVPVINEQYGKLPPQAIELERDVLGALMLEKGKDIIVLDILKPDSFYDEKHQKIFRAITELSVNHNPIDYHTVISQLKKNGSLYEIGGPHYIVSLTSKIGSAAHIEYHSRIIAEKYIQRELIRLSSEIQTRAYNDSEDIDNLLEFSQQEVFELALGSIKKETQRIDSVLKEALDQIEEASKREDGLSGTASGYTNLDRITSGWQKSDLIILAARPSMGKCLGKGTKVLMYSGNLKKVEDIQKGELLMGNDSTPRKVLSVTNGREKMYNVIQNKAINYKVNESHILSLKRSRNEGLHKNGDVLNISVKEYLKKSDKFKSNYKGYKTAVEFSEKQTEIEPYFLGLWLGDSKKSDIRIATTDFEIVDYLNYYTKHSLSLQHNLIKLNLLNNKHIPKKYLINSTKNRLDLLAGLIDSDGNYEKHCNGYEITQKDKKLAEQIKFLCDSLGFRTSINSKKAGIKNIEYETTVYRVRFFGDIDKIPVKIKRKKAKSWTCNSTWNQTGITVEYDKVDDYYGFEIDGNRLFLLEDMTVTHNTAFVVSMARNMSVVHDKAVAFFSLEMSSVQLVNRLISSETELNSNKLRNGQLNQHEWVQLDEKIQGLYKAKIFIDDTPAITLFELRSKCRKLKSKENIDIIIIDYLQLMSGPSESRGNREQEVSMISRGLKSIAKELNLPIIALSQLNRSVEMRSGDKRPQLSDLRESGAIEQDADIVMFIHRPEKMGITEDAEGNSTKGLAEIIIAKHRNGPVTNVNLRFREEFARFEESDSNEILPIAGDDPGVYTIGSSMNDDGMNSFESKDFENNSDIPPF